jgi:Na+-transporting NADH:ubiquinone oxidoreductase subunit A
MGTIKIKKGLDLPISGKPEQKVYDGPRIHQVAILGEDYIGMKPTLQVAIGDKVKLGQVVFIDKKMPAVKYTAPGSGKVVGIHRGEKRKFLSIVIQLEGDDEVTFKSYNDRQLKDLNKAAVIEQMIESGQWPLLRQRPFSKVANPEDTPNSIFVTAMDTNPLAPMVSLTLAGKEALFEAGLLILSKLTEGKIYVCKSPAENIPVGDVPRVDVENFTGKHPAGLVGTHIHFLDPVGRQKKVWYINAQDVVKLGYLFTTGKIMTEHIVALGGPQVKQPRLLKTRVGASLFDLTENELKDGENRIISGSVLSGRKATPEVGFLGRFHQQVSVLREGHEKIFLGWLRPGFDKFSAINMVASKLLGKKEFDFTTALNGGKRAIVPIGVYEKVIPLDIIPTYLLRSLVVNDIEELEKLGILELDEEDLALCTFVCQSKLDYGPMLRKNLTIIEKEG